MSKKAWIIFSVIVIGILVLLVSISGNDKIDVSKIDAHAVQLANKQNGNIADHVYGKKGSKIILIEYADYQCPACGSIYPITKPVIEKYKNQIQYVFRNFILSYHTNARAASATVEAASLQGKYWEMHNKMFENQSNWSELEGTYRDNLFKSYANSLGLDIDKFNNDLTSKSVSDKIRYDQALGNKAKVTGTPAFFINGSVLDGEKWSDKEKFEDVIIDELKKAKIPLPE